MTHDTPETLAAISHSISRYRHNTPDTRIDTLAVEEPMEIRLRWMENGDAHEEPLTITMRTPGHDIELVAGLLFSEGIVQDAAQILSIAVGDNPNTLTATLADSHQLDLKKYQRHFYSNSSCGVCGKMAIESLRLIHQPQLRGNFPQISAQQLVQLPDKLHAAQPLFEKTGGVHAAGLFNTSGELLLLREDVGRHNAVDKLLGACLLEKTFLIDDCVLMVSGRVGFEIVQKALAANLGFIAAVGAPTSLAVQLAEENGMTLAGFIKADSFNCYTHPERIHG
ncbi:MAG TPA: formate dehydrogenase accessory sulfurtransferase FdhD [Pseudomonadales bacterium]|nr:formate dehydrogenase accessory sulfurtransferase FdhD [Pseudomonadales bacterium]